MRDFVPNQSMEKGGILCVFPFFQTEEWVQKIRRNPQLLLCGVALSQLYDTAKQLQPQLAAAVSYTFLEPVPEGTGSCVGGTF